MVVVRVFWILEDFFNLRDFIDLVFVFVFVLWKIIDLLLLFSCGVERKGIVCLWDCVLLFEIFVVFIEM